MKSVQPCWEAGLGTPMGLGHPGVLSFLVKLREGGSVHAQGRWWCWRRRARGGTAPAAMGSVFWSHQGRAVRPGGNPRRAKNSSKWILWHALKSKTSCYGHGNRYGALVQQTTWPRGTCGAWSGGPSHGVALLSQVPPGKSTPEGV